MNNIKVAQADEFSVRVLTNLVVSPLSHRTVKARQARKNVEVWVRVMCFS